MKIKERALSILLSLVMVLTFMPALAFAEGDEAPSADNAPVVEEPLVEEPASEAPTVEEPVVEEKAEEDFVETPIEDFVEPEKEVLQADALNAGSFDENATAELILKDNRTITCDYDGEGLNFPIVGDKIVITYSDNETKTYEYMYNAENNDEDFYNGDEWLRHYYRMPLVGETSFVINVWDNYEDTTTFDTYITVPVTVESSVSSIAFSPASITVYSEDIAETDEGYVYYSLWNRHKYIDNEGDQCWSCFAEGDAITVNYSNGTSEAFTYKTTYTITDGEDTYSGYDMFVSGNSTLYPRVYDAYDLLPGQNNTIRIQYGGAVTTLNVFVDTPALRAQRAAIAAEAARQGTLDGSLPALKASKPKAAKKAITVKWKKLNKKQLKKGVTGIQVWVCADGAFANGSTIEKVVGKKKASLKIKGLQKGVTYYVKVRTVGPNGYGPWSAVKTVKVKK